MYMYVRICIELAVYVYICPFLLHPPPPPLSLSLSFSPSPSPSPSPSFSPSLPLSATPKLEQVMSVCDDVTEWVELGAALHTPQSDLDAIEQSHGDDPARCRRELFKVKKSYYCIHNYCLYIYIHVHVCTCM